MKKLLLYLLLAAGIAACSKDDNHVPDVPTPPVTEHLSIVAGTPGLSGNTLTVADAESDSEAELTLAGVSGSVTATVDPVSVQWLSAEVKSEPVEAAAAAAAEAEAGAEKDALVWKVILRAKAYTGNDDRTGFVTVKSGDDAIQVKVLQGGRGKKIRMVVVNEGQFTKGTSALSAIAYDGTTDFDIFRTVNKKPLGDVAQSITYIDGKYFVAINNSKQVAVVEPQTFELIETIDYEQDGKPRFIARLNENEAIVSDLTCQLVRIDIKNYKVIGHVDISAAVGVNGHVEKMTVVGKKLFCAAPGKGIGVFDTEGEVSASAMRFVEGFEGSIMTTCKLIEDKNGKLWVLATGKGGVLLNRIDPATEKVDKTVSIPYAAKGSEEYVPGAIVGTSFYTRWDTDRTRAKLYLFMNMLVNEQRGTSIGAIYTLDVDKDEIDPEPYRELPGLGMMYGMNISPDGDVFVCDCLDYTAQRGFLREYKADGSVDSRRVGVYPRMVHFTEYDKE
ncbi:DUF5074 domain-containing protein [uncultured Alistipes sp.]|uniref:DUF5074 domain-containing protein n=1 Tax=uncultured Alistipes sp. TaxID=538949 RepID=UPI0026195F9C|nr:DUF5074 domain-containing protein [uncultured Alistipes sp.]